MMADCNNHRNSATAGLCDHTIDTELMQKLKKPEFVCGWGAAFVNICVTFPVNKVMFRQQLYGVSTLKAIRQLKKEGITTMYRGLSLPLLQKTMSMSLMFGLYHGFYRGLNTLMPDMWSPVNKATAAMMAGTVEAVLTPFERIQVLMQDKNYHQRFNNPIDAAKQLKQYGITEFYRGQTAILLRNGPSNIMFFLGRDYLALAYPEEGSATQKVFLDFVCGACLGSLISTVFYPLNVVKVRMQSKVGGSHWRLVPTSVHLFRERNYSMKKMFRGVHVNYTRSFISWGIINATYEFLMKTFFIEEVSEE